MSGTTYMREASIRKQPNRPLIQVSTFRIKCER
ncbi:Uncharacterised protein [Vibrio cholerae]|nr:Uncharacterised protein [Vibrio cholerae]